jgi:hypothetical protein
MAMIPHPPPRSAAACLALLASMSLLTGCDRRPSDAPRPSDPEHSTPKPKVLPDTKVPDGLPASQPSQ